MKGSSTLALKDSERNKALFTFRIECSNLVSDVELEELLRLSGVTKDGTTVPTVSELKSADGTEAAKKIKIQGTEKFFKTAEALDKSELVRFKLKNTYANEVGQKIKEAVQPVVDAINNNGSSLADKYNNLTSSISQYFDYNLDGDNAWHYLATNQMREGEDTNTKELASLLDEAIKAGENCYAINQDSGVNEWLEAAKGFRTAYQAASDNKGKLTNLGIGLNRAFMACAKSIVLLGEAKGYTEDNFTANNSWYSYLKNTSSRNIDLWSGDASGCSIYICHDMYGMVESTGIVQQGIDKGLFGDATADLALDNPPLTEVEEGLQTADTFKVYQISGGSQSQLYLENDEKNNKKILTFEIPLDLPECKSVTENGETTNKKITSFMVYEEYKNAILENGYLASR